MSNLHIAFTVVIMMALPVSSFAENGVMTEKDTSEISDTWKYAAGIGGAAVITTMLFHYDQQIYDGIHKWNDNHAVREISPVITNLGDGAFSIGLFGGFAGYGLIFKDSKSLMAGKIGLESFLLTGAAVQLFKHLSGRERPSAATRDGGFWHGPFSYIREPKGGKSIASFDAFPSGHTVTIFAAATTISDIYTEPWVSYTCYSLASLTAISRIILSTHWMSDCFIGAIIGYYGTKLVEKWNNISSDVSLIPQVDEQMCGLILRVKI